MFRNNEPQEIEMKKSTSKHEIESLDLQYEICSQFMKKANEQVYQRELELIQESSNFIEKMQETMDRKDISSTQESLSFDSVLSHDQSFSQSSNSRILLRKSKSKTSLRRSDSTINEVLHEVQRKCSDKTSTMLSSMMNDYRKMKQKLAISEKNEKELKRLESRFETAEEELLMKRVSDLEKQNKIQSDQAQALRQRLKTLTEENKINTLSLSRSSENLKALTKEAAGQKLRRFLDEKEVRLHKKEKQVITIQGRIQVALDSVVPQDGCEKCCTMMKRIKDAIMKYRSLLQQQAQAAQQSYNLFKQRF